MPPASVNPRPAGAAAGATVVLARGVSKRFGDREVVTRLDLEVPRGVCFGLLGPNGAGKTTTLRMILGQSPISAGELSVFGEPMPAAARSVRARVGVVPQADNLDPDFTVSENLFVYARYFGLSRADVGGRIAALLDFVGLADRGDTPIEQLSGGMKRRLTIARALINDPELLILDEPTTGLDPQARHLIWARLRDLRRSGKTLLLTTHFMEEAQRLCDDLVIMDHGSVLSAGSPAMLIRRHAEPEVIEVRGDPARLQPVLDGLAGLRMETIGDTVYVYAADARPAIERLDRLPELVYLHRPTSLEDVFLRLTGRELRD